MSPHALQFSSQNAARKFAAQKKQSKTHKITIGVFRMEKTRTGSLLAFLAVCYAVAFNAGMITRPGISTWYATSAKPGSGLLGFFVIVVPLVLLLSFTLLI